MKEKRQEEQKPNSTQTQGGASCSVFCVPLGLRSMPCLLNHALCNKTRGPRCVHCVWRHPWCLHDVCLASGPLELTTWWTICIALPMNHELYTAMTMASVAFPRSTRDWYCHPCLSSVILRKHYESMVPTIRAIVKNTIRSSNQDVECSVPDSPNGNVVCPIRKLHMTENRSLISSNEDNWKLVSLRFF